MIPVEQEFAHDPDNGVYGDCFRACLASLLELPISEVPHIMHDNPPVEVYRQRTNSFLAEHDLFLFTVGGLWDFEEWRSTNCIIRDVYHIISDRSPRFPDAFHAVIGKNGEVVHDPHPTKLGLPTVSDERVFEFLVRLN